MTPHVHDRVLLSVKRLRFGWPGTTLWDSLDLDLAPGLSVVTGDEGCGKTTLLRLLAGELQPQAGQILLQGQPADTAQLSAAVAWTDPATTAVDTVRVSDHLAQLPDRFARTDTALLNDLLEGFGLQEHVHKTFHMLSAGSRRKVWIASAMASMAPVVLLDQPYAALDAPSMRLLDELLQDACESTQRLCVVADYLPPPAVKGARIIRLDA
ncbi:MAG: ATP-binding cassette domain-containing protein [Gammaproteobacteria bacterium]